MFITVKCEMEMLITVIRYLSYLIVMTELYEGPSKRSYACIQFSFKRGLN